MYRVRILAFTLVILMLATLFIGCGGNTSSNSDTGSITQSTTQSAASTAVILEPETITFYSTKSFQTDPVLWTEMELNKAILDKANVKIDYKRLELEKFNLAIAANEMGDINYCTGGTSSAKAITNANLALDMAPYLKTSLNNMTSCKEYNTAIELITKFSGEGKHLYFLPIHMGLEFARGGIETNRGFILRWDYYKEIGCPLINSVDDWIDCLEKMAKNHPKTADGKPTYGVGIFNSFSQWYFSGMWTQVKANPWTWSGYLYMESCEKDNYLFNGYMSTTESPFWLAMDMYRKLWAKGLLDPDSFTQKSDAYKAKQAAGQYMGSVGTLNKYLYQEESKKDPNTLAGMIVVPSTSAMIFADNPSLNGWFPSEQMFISSSTKKLDACLRLINVMYDLKSQRIVQCGEEGTYWKYVDGVPTLTDEAIAIKGEKGSKPNTSVGFGIVSPFIALEGSVNNLADKYPYDLFDSDEMRAASLNPLQKDFSTFYKVAYPGEAICKYDILKPGGTTVSWAAHTHGTEIVALAMDEIPTDISRIMSKCNDILYSKVYDLVTAPTDAKYLELQKKALSEMTAAGEATAWEWARNQWTKGYDEVSPFFK